MANSRMLCSIYSRESYQPNIMSKKTKRERLQKKHPNLTLNPLKIEDFKKTDRKTYIDSSYYLG